MEGQLSAPLSAYEVCRATFGDRLSVHQMRFALSETIAHLILLETEGRIQQVDPAAELIQYIAISKVTAEKASNTELMVGGFLLSGEALHSSMIWENARISIQAELESIFYSTYFNGLL